ncbi:MAG TPA: hypothetical protein VFJ93_01925 [Gaiellaceae bacterium]|nr:hypothetical protein [Gaiellaceae bacterium]
MSPELALVDPELRAYAVAGLPHVRAFSFLELRDLPVDEAPPSFRASAAFAYLLLAIMRTAAFDAVVFASVAACVLLASVLG